MAGLSEGGNEPAGSLKAICKYVSLCNEKVISVSYIWTRKKRRSLYRRLPKAADSLDRPPWNVVQRCWMASAMAPETDLLGKEFRLGPTGDFGGNLPKQEWYMDSVGCTNQPLRELCG
ncbi:hypothetical protein ANN_21201 [Periplaneta americana]|uniref:Per a allergen n=1 Tax=Periplaneta americana TaxID=6978 RepID=A0ABQ8SF39_PERAM|nr:hypothetical protein ANN_21201 [Periplaneta americana]